MRRRLKSEIVTWLTHQREEMRMLRAEIGEALNISERHVRNLLRRNDVNGDLTKDAVIDMIMYGIWNEKNFGDRNSLEDRDAARGCIIENLVLIETE